MVNGTSAGLPMSTPVSTDRRHEDRAVLGVEAAGELDLLRLLAGRQARAEEGLGRLVLLRRRLVQVDPARIVGHAVAVATATVRGPFSERL